MPEEKQTILRYRILRYTPNLFRDEWVNIGVLLEDVRARKRAIRLIEEPSEIARVRRLHPNADEELLRALPGEFGARLEGPEDAVRMHRVEPVPVRCAPARGQSGDHATRPFSRL